MHKFLTIFFISAGVLATTAVSAQDMGNSPYSRLGLGELNNSSGSIRSVGMGYTGAAAPNSNQINLQNPALLYFNNSVIFEMNLAAQLKSLKEADKTQRDGSTTLSAITLSLPVSKRWTTAIGLRPYSTVNYEATSTQAVIGNPAQGTLIKYSGEGSISEAHFSHGVRLAKNLNLGGSGSFMFGTINNYFASTLTNTDAAELVINKETVYRGFMFKTGLSYRYKVGEKNNLAIGGVYTFNSKLNADQRILTERPTTSGLLTAQTDSILDRKVSMPSGYQIGLSFDNGSTWSINADVNGQQWSEFKSAEGTQELVNATRVGLGGEYVPEPASAKYMRRVTYRAGFYTGTTPYNIVRQPNSTQIKESAVTWGFTFPLGRPSVTESYFLNLGFALGKRGTTENQLVQENFIRVQAGISLNNRWFIKRQLD